MSVYVSENKYHNVFLSKYSHVVGNIITYKNIKNQDLAIIKKTFTTCTHPSLLIPFSFVYWITVKTFVKLKFFSCESKESLLKRVLCYNMYTSILYASVEVENTLEKLFFIV